MDIQNEIIKTIDLMVEKRLDDRNLPRMVQSVVVGTSAKGYLCSINGSKYKVSCLTDAQLAPGTSVWVCIPYGDIKKAFIMGTVKASSGGGGGGIVIDEYDPNSHYAISGIGVANAFAVKKETEDLDFSDWE